MGPDKIIMKNKFYIAIVMALLMILSGCAGKTIYQWGEYEDLLYNRYMKPGDVPINQEIEQLTEQLDKTEAQGELVPPGLHAHLGYLYFITGNSGNALNHLRYEKQKFPESAHFIDGLIKRMKQ